MKNFAIVLLATSMLSAPVAFAASDNYQQPQGQQAQQSQNQNAKNPQNQPSGQQQSAENNPSNSQQMSPQSLSRGQIRQVQQALDKDGFKAGPTDGRWGRETENAVKQFQESKQLQATGQLDRQTVADLGLDASQFSQDQQK
jgi:peptidoglycan hydrolase-like protein with peptidoglycan-binding domain